MKIFALDSSTEKIVMVYKDNEKILTFSYKGKDKHGKNIGLLSQKLKDLGIDFYGLDIIGVGIGPGSITGLRVGISFALGLGLGKKMVTIPSTKIIAANLLNCGKNIVVARKARQGYLYGAVYDSKLNVLIEPFINSIDGFRKVISKCSDYIVIGDGSEFLEDNGLKDDFNYPSPERLLYVFEREIESENFAETVQPLYLQKSIAEINFEKRRKGE
ncbi:tRNA (adenosine(37)-N6)-threonylcarbamoyltransferase complex dimerization subunit type 1 TsaB [Thermosipho atlanticus]|uniref:tRNA threonylcarbamoyl adenosine modification protein YeaZ n=1 Tax=Thermosipho atlanticus DSM 15807 TaxID=1123380 RepID=A0A1M5TZA2_9BACT|nr:tRNA (adenosine(37)-N6)-threonylcarbamoyltransferase complex dimerization subunit type 1 TsaB [Thermosipho atlanticus]SHH55940.1 tRNA threonylcarbamoyl adenosine modification protein YeaZ [Thermosipho atlanticus DSM 15807]